MNFLRTRRKRVGASGDTVVEARADAKHHVAIVHGHVGFVGAVHAKHSEPVLAGCRIGAETHQCRGDRETGGFDQFAQQLRGFQPGIDDAAAAVDHRPLGGGEQRHGLADLRRIALHPRRIGHMHIGLARRVIIAQRELHVLWHIDHHRTGTAGAGDIERLVQHLG